MSGNDKRRLTTRVTCPACGAMWKAEERHAGRSISCPACRKPINIPAARQTSEAPVSESVDPFAADAEKLFAPPKVTPPVTAATNPAPHKPHAATKRLTPSKSESADSKEQTSSTKKTRPNPAATTPFNSESPRAIQSPVDSPPEQLPGIVELSEDTSTTFSPDSPTPDDGGFPDLSEDELAGEAISPPRKKKNTKNEEISHPALASKPSKRRAVAPREPLGWRMHLHWLLVLALVPLAFSITHGSGGIEELEARIQKSLEEYPEVDPEFIQEASSLQEIAMQFPDHRINGALLASDTFLHWGFALASGGLFLTLFLVMWPGGGTRLGLLCLMGTITGTAGIFLLLTFQWMTLHSQDVMPRRGGVVAFVFLIVKLIGYSYRAALDDANGFIPSFLGFTFGVGLCEELCKALPVAAYLTGHERPSVRMTCLVGLASGVGFGVFEGITYSSEHYNGVSDIGIYLVRFLSCVALHGIWTGSVAILMHRNQDHLEYSWEAAWQFVVFYLLVAMILHGAYDTLLKQQREVWALVVAVVSFGWLQWLISRPTSENRPA